MPGFRVDGHIYIFNLIYLCLEPSNGRTSSSQSRATSLVESDAILFTLLLEFTHVAMWAVDRKHGLQITDYRLTCMSCDTARHHVTVILLGWL